VKPDVDDRTQHLPQQTIDHFEQATQMVEDDGWNNTAGSSILI
jgi:hypothetical protein